MRIVYIGKIVGVTFSPAKENFEEIIKRFKADDELHVGLMHEPQNQYDSNAVAVYAWTKNENRKLRVGFVPKPNNTDVLKAGIENLYTVVTRINEHDGKAVGLNISIEEPDKPTGDRLSEVADPEVETLRTQVKTFKLEK